MFGKFEDLLVVLVIVLILFGAKKLPELSRGIAESIKEIRKGFSDEPSVKPSVQEQTATADASVKAKSKV